MVCRRPSLNLLADGLVQELSPQSTTQLDNRRLENVARSDESQFIMQILHKQPDSMDPSTIQALVVGVMVKGIFACFTLGPFIPNGN